MTEQLPPRPDPLDFGPDPYTDLLCSAVARAILDELDHQLSFDLALEANNLLAANYYWSMGQECAKRADIILNELLQD